ncbi:MAG: DUF1572 domain-containing protein [Acidobacteriota bacterium]|nr:DUF1572 domain-containing protein [Acidobacteriota bacterium]
MSGQSITQHYLDDIRASFRAYKKLAEKALAQINDEEYFVTLDAESNSIAVIMKHMAGNMISRWTDFLTTDGEKPDRNRDFEFVIEPEATKASLLGYWEKGWACLFASLEPLPPEALGRKVFIRGEEHTVVQAINRQMTHYAYHIGQIVFLAKHFRSNEWKSLSVPKNRSAGFNEYLEKKLQSGEGQHRFDVAAGFVSESE